MKKIIPIFLALVLAVSSTACSPKNEHVANAEKYGYLSVFNTSWGMSTADCIDALGLNSDNIKVQNLADFEENSSGSSEVLFIETTMNFMNEDMKAVFMFEKFIKADLDWGLSEVRLEAKHEIPLVDAENAVFALYKEQGIECAKGKKPMVFSSVISNQGTIEKLNNEALAKRSIEIQKSIYPEDFELREIENILKLPLDSCYFLSDNLETAKLPEDIAISEIYFSAGSARELIYAVKNPT